MENDINWSIIEVKIKIISLYG